MKILIFLVFIILIASVILTLLLTGKSDDNYRESTRKNTLNLSFIYIVIILVSLSVLGGYIWWIN